MLILCIVSGVWGNWMIGGGGFEKLQLGGRRQNEDSKDISFVFKGLQQIYVL